MVSSCKDGFCRSRIRKYRKIRQYLPRFCRLHQSPYFPSLAAQPYSNDNPTVRRRFPRFLIEC